MSHTITDIHILKKKVVLYFGKEKLEITPNTYTNFTLYLNKQLTDKEYEALKADDSYQKDLAYALNLVGKYAYCESKLIKKLKQKQISEDHINQILTYLRKHHLIDDEAFALDYAMSLLTRHKGERFIKEALRALMIKPTIIEKVMGEINQKDYALALNKYIKALDRRYTRSNATNKRAKITDACLRSGYSYQEINQALSKIKLTPVNYPDALLKDYTKFKRQYDDERKIMMALKRKGYSYSKIKAVMGENYDLS
ncbi:MAG: RecX family transcriptional regulator [Bacilli bacterium]|nr:RecX family transcriptional regulator [Bacilli bacterium]